MNVFVLCTGRCGSTTFARAASHIRNFTTDRESRVRLIGGDRFSYPSNHIESDNRLAWMLGRLEEAFGKDAFYVHLTRNSGEVARSFNHRWHLKNGIISAYRNGILSGAEDADPYDVCVDLVETMNSNIRAFLADKPLRMDFELENAERDWAVFWERIGAEGDIAASQEEWKVLYNETPRKKSFLERAVGAASRIPHQLRH